MKINATFTSQSKNWPKGFQESKDVSPYKINFLMKHANKSTRKHECCYKHVKNIRFLFFIQCLKISIAMQIRQFSVFIEDSFSKAQTQSCKKRDGFEKKNYIILKKKLSLAFVMFVKRFFCFSSPFARQFRHQQSAEKENYDEILHVFLQFERASAISIFISC